MDTSITEHSALFLDRDGVINRRIVAGYVKHPQQFEFLPGVVEAIRILSSHFPYVFVVTNQQGIGKFVMTEEDLRRVHEVMIEGIEKGGGRLDAIYYAPQHRFRRSPMRKPGVGMAVLARQEFPDINLDESWMVGDTINDMLFGRAVAMRTVFIRTNADVYPGDLADMTYATLYDFALAFDEAARGVGDMP